MNFLDDGREAKKFKTITYYTISGKENSLSGSPPLCIPHIIL